MRPALQHCDFRNCIADMTVDNAAFAFAELDTLGYDYAVIVISLGNVPANMGGCLLTESDTSGSGHATISGTTIGTDTDIDGSATTLPTAAAGDGDQIVYFVDLTNGTRKRYIDATITAGNGSGTATECSAIAILGRGKIGKDAAADYDAEIIMSV